MSHVHVNRNQPTGMVSAHAKFLTSWDVVEIRAGSPVTEPPLAMLAFAEKKKEDEVTAGHR